MNDIGVEALNRENVRLLRQIAQGGALMQYPDGWKVGGWNAVYSTVVHEWLSWGVIGRETAIQFNPRYRITLVGRALLAEIDWCPPEELLRQAGACGMAISSMTIPEFGLLGEERLAYIDWRKIRIETKGRIRRVWLI